VTRRPKIVTQNIYKLIWLLLLIFSSRTNTQQRRQRILKYKRSSKIQNLPARLSWVDAPSAPLRKKCLRQGKGLRESVCWGVTPNRGAISEEALYPAKLIFSRYYLKPVLRLFLKVGLQF